MEDNIYVLFALSLPGTKIEYPFGPEMLVVKAYGKMMLIVSVTNGNMNMSMKCNPALAISLRDEFDYIRPGYHLNKKHWNTVYLDQLVREENIKFLIEHSYECVIHALPKFKQEEIKNNGYYRKENSNKEQKPFEW